MGFNSVFKGLIVFLKVIVTAISCLLPSTTVKPPRHAAYGAMLAQGVGGSVGPALIGQVGGEKKPDC